MGVKQRVAFAIPAREGVDWHDYDPTPLIGKWFDGEVTMGGIVLASGRYQFISMKPTDDGLNLWVVMQR